MKKLVLVIATIMVVSCRQGDAVDKPERLLEEIDMVNIMYDLSLLQAMHNQANRTLETNGIDPKTYIFTKYKIDSTTFTQNHRYYASQLDQYEKIQKKVKEKLEAEKAKIKTPAKK